MTQKYAADYGVFPIDFNTIYESVKNTPRNGVISGLSITTLGTMFLTINTGVARANGVIRTINIFSLQISASHPTLPRKDLIVIDSSGNVVVREGLPITIAPVGKSRRETHDPDVSDLTAGDLPIAEVWVAAGATQIQSADISDRRIDTTYSEYGNNVRYVHEYPGADDKLKIENALNAAGANDTVFLVKGKGTGSNGEYQWTETASGASISLSSNKKIDSNGATIKGPNTVFISNFFSSAPSPVSNVHISNIIFDANVMAWTGGSPTGVQNPINFGANGSYIKDSSLRNLYFKNCRGGGAVVNWGISVVGNDRNVIENIIIENATASLYLHNGSGWDIRNIKLSVTDSTTGIVPVAFNTGGFSLSTVTDSIFSNIQLQGIPEGGDFGVYLNSNCNNVFGYGILTRNYVAEHIMFSSGSKNCHINGSLNLFNVTSVNSTTQGVLFGRSGVQVEDCSVSNITVLHDVNANNNQIIFWYDLIGDGGSTRCGVHNLKAYVYQGATVLFLGTTNGRTVDAFADGVGYYGNISSSPSLAPPLKVFNLYNLDDSAERYVEDLNINKMKLRSQPLASGYLGWNATALSPSWHDGTAERLVVHKDIRQEIQSAGIAVGTRGRLNFTSGATVTDDAANNRINVNITGGGGPDAPVGAYYFTMGTDATLLNEQSIRGTDPTTLLDDNILFRWNSPSYRTFTLDNIGGQRADLILNNGWLTVNGNNWVIAANGQFDFIDSADLSRINFGIKRFKLGSVTIETGGNEGDFWYSSSMRRLRMRDETTTTKEIALLSDLNFATFIPVEATLPASGAPTLSQIDGTNTSYRVLSFADGVTQTAYWQFAMPRNWRETRMESIIRWRAPTANTGSVYWEYGVLGVNNNENMDGVYSIDFVLQPPSTTAGNTKFTTIPLTPINFDLASNDILQFFLRRVGGDVSDTLADVAQLIEITIQLQGNLS